MKNLWMIAAFVLTALMIGGCGMFQVMDGVEEERKNVGI